ncbi:MAG: betaine--homocysteine S-methyltransferase [Pseudomonadota bacterium]
MLQELLAARAWLLADGATGTNLFDVGLTSGDAPELWCDEEPDKIIGLHRSFVEAGADIILTNTFGANARRLMLHKAEDRVGELNQRAAELARSATEDADRPVVIAGSVGPTGDLLVPLGPLTKGDARAVFAEQIAGLKAGGADVIWIETMSSADEIAAAAEAAIAADMPYTVTASFDTAGRTMMGLPPEAFAEAMAGLEVPPVAIGANCGVGASDTLLALQGLTAAAGDIPVISKANAGVPEIRGDSVHYSGSPELMARYAGLALDTGATIVGGCCGTTARHLDAMRAALEAHERTDPPALETITAATGPLVSPPADPASEAHEKTRSRRRRRPSG